MAGNERIGGLGEVALRVNDLDASQAFYAEKIGLELMRRFPTSAFFKIGDGFAGHTVILALFDRSSRVGQGKTTLDHLAFTIDIADFATEKARLESLGVPTRETTHGWVQWRSIYVEDPDGNTVEFVAFDPSIPKED